MTGQVEHTLAGHDDHVYPVLFSLDGMKLASGSGGGIVRVWDIKTCEVEHTFVGHTDTVEVLAFSPDGSKKASRSNDHSVRL